jgi:hypothetical protein
MKTWSETVAHRQGEWLGPLDDNYDYSQHKAYPNNPEIVQEKIQMMREIETLFLNGKKLKVSYDDCLAGELLQIGMYDGWPFWKPTPAFMIKTWHGGDIHFWYDVREYWDME